MSEPSAVELQQQHPPSCGKWSWGAALLNIIWGGKHGIDVAFLTLVPVLGLGVPILLGLKGNQWAWEKGGWKSVEHFERVQRNWAFWGFITWFFIFIVLFIPLMFGIVQLKWQHSKIYKDAMTEFVKIDKIRTLLGEPIQGRVAAAKTLSSDQARFSVRLKGSKTRATVRFHLMKIEKQWSVYRMTLYNATGQAGIDFPLPEHMLMVGEGNPVPAQDENQVRYDVVLKSVGEAELYSLSSVLCDLDNTLGKKAAIEAVRYAPKIIYQGATLAGALKIQRKLQDYGAVVAIEKKQIGNE
ncbi:hypothetical protein K8S19_06540 [bacterium]|nr:hypothetical protein [bacterium]